MTDQSYFGVHAIAEQRTGLAVVIITRYATLQSNVRKISQLNTYIQINHQKILPLRKKIIF